MAELYNCPNCGAPITGEKCEYCGTRFKEDSWEDEIDFLPVSCRFLKKDLEVLYADGVPIFEVEK